MTISFTFQPNIHISEYTHTQTQSLGLYHSDLFKYNYPKIEPFNSKTEKNEKLAIKRLLFYSFWYFFHENKLFPVSACKTLNVFFAILASLKTSGDKKCFQKWEGGRKKITFRENILYTPAHENEISPQFILHENSFLVCIIIYWLWFYLLIKFSCSILEIWILVSYSSVLYTCGATMPLPGSIKLMRIHI